MRHTEAGWILHMLMLGDLQATEAPSQCCPPDLMMSLLLLLFSVQAQNCLFTSIFHVLPARLFLSNKGLERDEVETSRWTELGDFINLLPEATTSAGLMDRMVFANVLTEHVHVWSLSQKV